MSKTRRQKKKATKPHEQAKKTLLNSGMNKPKTCSSKAIVGTTPIVKQLRYTNKQRTQRAKNLKI